MDKTAIEHFLRTQVQAWNQGDRDGFLGAYRAVAPQGLQIEHVGKAAIPADGWPVLEGIWADQSAKVEIEVAALIVNGHEAALHNLNKVRGTPVVIHTIELYRFEAGRLFVRYFIAHP